MQQLHLLRRQLVGKVTYCLSTASRITLDNQPYLRPNCTRPCKTDVHCAATNCKQVQEATAADQQSHGQQIDAASLCVHLQVSLPGFKVCRNVLTCVLLLLLLL
jgi:hypothetical protein